MPRQHPHKTLHTTAIHSKSNYGYKERDRLLTKRSPIPGPLALSTVFATVRQNAWRCQTRCVLYRRKRYVQRFCAWLHIVVKGLCLDLHGLAARRGTTASKVGGLLLSEFHTRFFYRGWENNMRQTPCNVFFFVAPTVVYPCPCLHHLVAWQGSRRQRIQPESSPRSLS